MWLIPRRASSPSSPASEGWTSASEGPFREAESSLTWRGKRLRARSCFAAWRTDNWTRHLFSRAMCGSSLPPDFEGTWTPSLPASPAPRSATQDAEEDRRTSVGCGPRSSGFYARRLPNGAWSKTSPGSLQRTLDGSLEAYSPIWTDWGTMRSGVVYQRPPWEPPTSASASSCSPDGDRWPTPRAEERGQHNSQDQGVALSRKSALWRTPSAEEVGPRPETLSSADGGPPVIGRRIYRISPTGRRYNTQQTVGLQAEMWRTPAASDPEGGVMDLDLAERMGYNPKIKLRDQATCWATPISRDHKDGAMDPDAKTPTNFLLGRQAPRMMHGRGYSNDGPTSPRLPSRPRLNYRFVSWLMGLDPDWCNPYVRLGPTPSAPSGTPSSRRRPKRPSGSSTRG